MATGQRDSNPDAKLDLETIARQFHERQLKSPLLSTAELIHEDAEMRLVVSDRVTLYGRDQIIARLLDAREQMIYSANVDHCEVLDEDTLLV